MSVNVIETFVPKMRLKRVFVAKSISPIGEEIPTNAIEVGNVRVSEVENEIVVSASKKMLFPMSYNRIYITDENKILQVGFKTLLTEESEDIIVDLRIKLCLKHLVGEVLSC